MILLQFRKSNEDTLQYFSKHGEMEDPNVQLEKGDMLRHKQFLKHDCKGM